MAKGRGSPTAVVAAILNLIEIALVIRRVSPITHREIIPIAINNLFETPLEDLGCISRVRQPGRRSRPEKIFRSLGVGQLPATRELDDPIPATSHLGIVARRIGTIPNQLHRHAV